MIIEYEQGKKPIRDKKNPRGYRWQPIMRYVWYTDNYKDGDGAPMVILYLIMAHSGDQPAQLRIAPTHVYGKPHFLDPLYYHSKRKVKELNLNDARTIIRQWAHQEYRKPPPGWTLRDRDGSYLLKR